MRLVIAFLLGTLFLSFQQVQAVGTQHAAAVGLGAWSGYKIFKTLSNPSKRRQLSRFFQSHLKIERQAAKKTFFKLIRRGISVAAAVAVLCGGKIPSGMSSLFLLWLFGFKPGEIGLWWLASEGGSNWEFEFEFGSKKAAAPQGGNPL